MCIFKRRVKFIDKQTNELGIGYLHKDKWFAGGYYIETKSRTGRLELRSIVTISDINKI
jgi:hypothetical protein